MQAASLSFVPDALIPVLEDAALRYARMSPADFSHEGILYVGSTQLRNVGLIDAAMWAKIPANDRVRVQRDATGALSARVLVAGP